MYSSEKGRKMGSVETTNCYDSMPMLYADTLFTAELLVKRFGFECLEVRSGPPKLWVLQPPFPWVGNEHFIKAIRAHYFRCRIEGKEFPGGEIDIHLEDEGIHTKVYVGDPPC